MKNYNRKKFRRSLLITHIPLVPFVIYKYIEDGYPSLMTISFYCAVITGVQCVRWLHAADRKHPELELFVDGFSLTFDEDGKLPRWIPEDIECNTVFLILMKWYVTHLVLLVIYVICLARHYP